MSQLLDARGQRAVVCRSGSSTLELARAVGAGVLLAAPRARIRRSLPPYKARQPALRVPFFGQVAAGLGRKPGPARSWCRRRSCSGSWHRVVFVLLVAAAARPELVVPPVQKTESARDLLLAVDISELDEHAATSSTRRASGWSGSTP